MEQVPRIMEALAHAARFGDDSSAYEAVAASATQRWVGVCNQRGLGRSEMKGGLGRSRSAAQRCQAPVPPPCLALPPYRVAAEEEESAVAERRQELFTLFKNSAKLDRGGAYAFVGARLQGALGGGDAPWQDVELAISLLYQVLLLIIECCLLYLRAGCGCGARHRLAVPGAAERGGCW